MWCFELLQDSEKEETAYRVVKVNLTLESLRQRADQICPWPDCADLLNL